MAGEDPILEELRTQTGWLRLLALQTLRPALESALPTDRQKLAYELSDGSRGTRQVAEAVGAGPGTISRWWTEWIALGICSEVPGSAGRARHLASLSALGVPVPKLGGPAPVGAPA